MKCRIYGHCSLCRKQLTSREMYMRAVYCGKCSNEVAMLFKWKQADYLKKLDRLNDNTMG
jgi:hypothetical protein